MNRYLVLQARAEARAILYDAGEFVSLDDAIAPLHEYATRTGLFDEVGESGYIAIIQSTFNAKQSG